MEKINSEELKNMLGSEALNNEELEQVSGGGDQCRSTCLFLYDIDSPLYRSCLGQCRG